MTPQDDRGENEPRQGSNDRNGVVAAAVALLVLQQLIVLFVVIIVVFRHVPRYGGIEMNTAPRHCWTDTNVVAAAAGTIFALARVFLRTAVAAESDHERRGI